MSIVRKKKLWAAAVACSAGMLFQYLPTGCTEFFTSAGLSSFDFCSVFNCTGGSFFNFCEPVPLLLDCPNIGGDNP